MKTGEMKGIAGRSLSALGRALIFTASPTYRAASALQQYQVAHPEKPICLDTSGRIGTGLSHSVLSRLRCVGGITEIHLEASSSVWDIYSDLSGLDKKIRGFRGGTFFETGSAKPTITIANQIANLPLCRAIDDKNHELIGRGWASLLLLCLAGIDIDVIHKVIDGQMTGNPGMVFVCGAMLNIIVCGVALFFASDPFSPYSDGGNTKAPGCGKIAPLCPTTNSSSKAPVSIT